MSSLLSKIGHLLGIGAAAAAKFAIAIGKTEVKVAAASPFGVALLTAIKAGEAGTTNVEKIALGIESLVPFIVKEISDPTALQADIETTARLAIEAVLPQVKDAATAPVLMLQKLAASV